MLETVNTLIKQHLESLNDDDLISIYNDYARLNSCEIVYDLNDITFDDLIEGPSEAIKITNHKGFNEDDYYFIISPLDGLLWSFSDVAEENSPIYLDDLSEWILKQNMLEYYGINIAMQYDDVIKYFGNVTLSKVDDNEYQSNDINGKGIMSVYVMRGETINDDLTLIELFGLTDIERITINGIEIY